MNTTLLLAINLILFLILEIFFYFRLKQIIKVITDTYPTKKIEKWKKIVFRILTWLTLIFFWMLNTFIIYASK